MEKIKVGGKVHPEVGLVVDKLDEMVEWMNKHDSEQSKYKDMMDRLMVMKEKEHKVAMETAKLSVDMIKKMTENLSKE